MIKEAPEKAAATKEEISRAISYVASSFHRLVLIQRVPDIRSAADHDESLVDRAVVLKEDPPLVYAILPWTHTLTAYRDREYSKTSNCRQPPCIYRFVRRACN